MPQCGTFSLFRFYVKIILVNLESQKIFRAVEKFPHCEGGKEVEEAFLVKQTKNYAKIVVSCTTFYLELCFS